VILGWVPIPARRPVVESLPGLRMTWTAQKLESSHPLRLEFDLNRLWFGVAGAVAAGCGSSGEDGSGSY